MKRLKILIIGCIVLGLPALLQAQCSICTKTTSQLGRNAAEGFNSGIVYLMFIPFVIMGFVGFRWWRQERRVIHDEQQ